MLVPDFYWYYQFMVAFIVQWVYNLTEIFCLVYIWNLPNAHFYLCDVCVKCVHIWGWESEVV